MDERVDQSNGGVLVLAGGGIDSSTCIATLTFEGFKVRALHVDFGQPAADREWGAVAKISRHYGTTCDQIKVTSPKKIAGGFVEGRNALFVFLALANRSPQERLICLGIHAGTPFYDCGEMFHSDTARLVRFLTDGGVQLIAPLLQLRKSEIVALSRKVGVPLTATYSCQLGGEPCGECLSCRDRAATKC